MYKTITWNSNWIHPFESVWSIFEKLKIANKVSSTDILKNFLVETVKRQTKSNLWAELIYLENLELDTLSKIIKFDIREHHEFYMDQALGVLRYLPTERSIHFHIDFRYCISCLSLGHHSYLHQLKIISHCPYHYLPLCNQCNNCGTIFKYVLSDKNWLAPFICKCGRALSSHKLSTDLWSKFAEIDVNDSIRLALGSINSKSEFINTMNPILVNIIKNTNDNSQIYHSVAFRLQKSKNIKSLDIETQPFWDLIYKRLRQVFKSIDANIKKTVLVNHRSCIYRSERLFKGVFPKYNVYCPYAAAYLSWKTDMQDLLENKYKLKNTPLQKLFYSLLSILNVDNKYKNKNEAIIWALSKLSGIIVKRYFDLHLIMKCSSERMELLHMISWLIYEPSLILKTDEELLQFRISHEVIDIKSSELLMLRSCPFKTVKSRRKKYTVKYLLNNVIS